MEILTRTLCRGLWVKPCHEYPPFWTGTSQRTGVWRLITVFPPSRYRLVVPGFYSHFWQTSLFVYLQEDGDSVGFATLPEQVHRKAIKRGFDFTLMVVGMYRWSESCYIFGDSYIKISSQQSTQGKIYPKWCEIYMPPKWFFTPWYFFNVK